MRGTDLEYNNSLGLLKTMFTLDNGINIKTKTEDTKQNIELNHINTHIKRVYYPETSKNKAGYFRYAIFENSFGNTYKITRDGELYKKTRQGFRLLKTHTAVLKTEGSCDWIYRNVCFTKGRDMHFVAMHILMMTCAYSNFLDLYLSSSNLVVNHCKLTNDKEVRDHSYDALNHLEIITSKQNQRHGYLVKRFGLTEIHAEINDLEKLAPCFIDIRELKGKQKEDAIRENRNLLNAYNIINIYQSKGEIWVD